MVRTLFLGISRLRNGLLVVLRVLWVIVVFFVLAIFRRESGGANPGKMYMWFEPSWGTAATTDQCRFHPFGVS